MIILKIIFIIVFVIVASIDLALRDGDEFKDFQEFIRRHKK